jgi:hypothetical protein
MATRKTPKPKAKPKATPAPTRLQNLAARPAAFDETMDEQLVDHSGVFRVTSAISQAQTGHGEEASRFANDSLVMQAQRDGFRDDGPTIDEAVEIDDEALQAQKRERLRTLAALNQTRGKRR